jgi:hypothetical protein
MSYTINHYNGAILTTVADGTVVTSTDLTLVGKNYAGYGQAQNDNFVWLLENFANTTSPPNPLAGQIWFDSSPGATKLKFFDGTNWRTTGGAAIGPSSPTGLTVGDFWFNTTSNQLFAYTSDPVAPFKLIGPQGVSGAGLTQMQSTTVQDTNGNSHAIIQAIDNNQTIFVISSDPAFTLQNSINSITGFGRIQQGITLAYTDSNATGAVAGVTNPSVNHRFWGTATNADKLNGVAASGYVLAANPTFSNSVNFPLGYTVGSAGAPPLKVFINSTSSHPTVQGAITDTIVFQTTLANQSLAYPLTIKGADLLPGGSQANLPFSTGVNNIGSSTYQWNNVYATNFLGTATNANNLNLNGSFVTANTAAIANTIAARDATNTIFATTFNGTATAADYADLAEKYLCDKEYAVGTVVSVGGTQEMTACKSGDRAIGAVSENPAFMMNQTLKGGLYIALKGRVPVKIKGTVAKGDRIIADNDGCGIALNHSHQDVFAVALQSSDDEGVKLVECVIL